jgi:hypothetical protein
MEEVKLYVHAFLISALGGAKLLAFCPLTFILRRMRGAIPPLSLTSAWRGDYLSRVYAMQVGSQKSSAGDAHADISYKWNNGSRNLLRSSSCRTFHNFHETSARASPRLDCREPTSIVHMRLFAPGTTLLLHWLHKGASRQLDLVLQ